MSFGIRFYSSVDAIKFARLGTESLCIPTFRF